MLEKIETNFSLFSDVLLAMNGDNPGSLCNAANLTLAMWSIYAVLHFCRADHWHMVAGPEGRLWADEELC